MSSGARTSAAIAIDGDRLWRELDELAQFSEVPPPPSLALFSVTLIAARVITSGHYAGRRSSTSAKTRSATPSLAGLEPMSRCLRSRRDRTSTPFQMPADSMEPLVC